MQHTVLKGTAGHVHARGVAGLLRRPTRRPSQCRASQEYYETGAQLDLFGQARLLVRQVRSILKRLRGQQLRQSSQAGEEETRAAGRSESKVDGDGKSGARGKISGAKCLFQVHFPSSASILGPKLGVECSASGSCRICKKPGHWSEECPQHWATHQMCFQGYRPSGSRTRGKWDDEKNPLKETAKKWVRFLQDKKHYPAGGVPALEPNTPSLAAFQAWVGKAAA